MGREVRRVPADWKHPETIVDSDFLNPGSTRIGYIPLYDQPFGKAAKEWKENFLAWEAGYNVTFERDCDGEELTMEYWEYNRDPPDPSSYRPEWAEESRTHYQMYETCSEGTPISPVMESPEKLAKWLYENGASSLGSMTATYEQWLRVCQGGYAPSMVVENSDKGQVTKSGVEGPSD